MLRMLREGVTLAAREREGGRMVGQLVMEVGAGRRDGEGTLHCNRSTNEASVPWERNPPPTPPCWPGLFLVLTCNLCGCRLFTHWPHKNIKVILRGKKLRSYHKTLFNNTVFTNKAFDQPWLFVNNLVLPNVPAPRYSDPGWARFWHLGSSAVLWPASMFSSLAAIDSVLDLGFLSVERGSRGRGLAGSLVGGEYRPAQESRESD